MKKSQERNLGEISTLGFYSAILIPPRDGCHYPLYKTARKIIHVQFLHLPVQVTVTEMLEKEKVQEALGFFKRKSGTLALRKHANNCALGNANSTGLSIVINIC